MRIEAAEQESSDLDWFCIDESGCIGHFASAGFKRIPTSVAQSVEDLTLVTEYFKTAVVIGGYGLDSSLPREVPDWKGEHNEARYLASFVSMAARGLYSYDIQTHVVPGLAYFRVAIPERALLVTRLPSAVQRAVSRTVLPRTLFRDCSSIPYEDTLAL